MNHSETDIKTDDLWIGLREHELDVEGLTAFLHTYRAGGINIFIGTTRRLTDGKETVSLDYEAYAPMAIKEMDRILDQARKRWPIQKVVAFHRLGRVPAGESSIFLGVATPHRVASFEACLFLIDTIKQEVPIWKKELYSDGTQEWVQGQLPRSATGKLT
jgi:molybdopterin synthase catalytic subunit